jgi:hypothetical protein
LALIKIKIEAKSATSQVGQVIPIFGLRALLPI